MASLSDEASSLASGTELTVMMDESCLSEKRDGGSLSAQIISQNMSDTEAASPSGIKAFQYRLPGNMKIGELKEIVEADSCVVGVSDETYAFATAELSSDPLVKNQGHLAMLEAIQGYNALQAQSVAVSPVTIAVIDTGIDLKHEDFVNQLWRNTKEVESNGIDDDRNGYVDDVFGYNFASKIGSPSYQGTWGGYHHGTHVAGLAAANGTNGVGGSGVMAKGVQVMALNVFGADAGASTSAVANAIRYAADNGAKVINMSIGGSGKNAAYESAINYAIKKGVTIFAAAGNEKTLLSDTRFLAPGSYGSMFKGMLNVGSVDSSNFALSTFSNYSPTMVEVGAPGSEDSVKRVGVLSTMPGNRYSRIQGTSMATPVAAGVGALAISILEGRGYNPTPALIEEVLAGSAKSVSALRTKISEGRVLNVKSLVDYIQKKYPTKTRPFDQKPGSTTNCLN
jgi:subtilisin family serine protease